MRGLVAVLVVGLVACGDDDGTPSEQVDGGSPQNDAAPDLPDAATWGDASVPCSPAISFPDDIQADDTVVFWAGDFSASEYVEWTVWRPDESFVKLPSGSNQQQLELHLDRVGSWEIEARACGRSDKRTFHVRHPDARTGQVRLRFWPTPQQDLPAQEYQAIIHVPGGGHYEIPYHLLLASGQQVNGRLDIDEDGTIAPLGGELRLFPASGPPVTLIADGDGHYHGRVHASSHRLDLVPRDSRKASLRREVATSDLRDGLVVDAGRLVHGQVLAGGLPVVGATVALSLGDLPAALHTTDELGRFAIRAHEGGPLSLRVDGESEELPSVLAGPELALVADGGEIVVDLPAPTTATAQLTVTTSTGAPIAGASLVLVGDGLAGTVSQDGRSGPAQHDTRRRLVTGAGGLVSASVPPGRYEVIIEPPAGLGEGMTVQTVEIVAGPSAPVTLKTSPPKARRLKLVDARDGHPVGNEVQILAVSRGYAGVGAGVAVSGLPPDDVQGTVDLLLVDNVAYDVLVIPHGNSAVARQRLTLPTGGEGVQEVRLERRMILRGELILPSGGAARGVRVSAVCADCPTPEIELGETKTTSLGEFRLEMPDPGLETP